MRYRFLRFPEGKEKALTLSYDDGHEADLKLVEIANKYGIKLTLNINAGENGIPYGGEHLSLEQICEIEKMDHEIAVHGEYHKANGLVSSVDGIKDVLFCRLTLERSLGKIIRGMAYPDSGIRRLTNVALNEIKSYLKSLGIAYSRTLGEDNDRFEIPNDFYEWMPTAHHDNPNLFVWLDKFLNTPLSKYCGARSPWLFYLWGHSFEFKNKNNWERFEEFCQKASGKEDVWYATNIEICDYVRDYYRLEFNVDNTIVHNPTARTIWFEYNNKTFSVKSGETLNLE